MKKASILYLEAHCSTRIRRHLIGYEDSHIVLFRYSLQPRQVLGQLLLSVSQLAAARIIHTEQSDGRVYDLDVAALERKYFILGFLQTAEYIFIRLGSTEIFIETIPNDRISQYAILNQSFWR